MSACCGTNAPAVHAAFARLRVSVCDLIMCALFTCPSESYFAVSRRLGGGVVAGKGDWYCSYYYPLWQLLTVEAWLERHAAATGSPGTRGTRRLSQEYYAPSPSLVFCGRLRLTFQENNQVWKDVARYSPLSHSLVLRYRGYSRPRPGAKLKQPSANWQT